jgi:uncharacterized protein (TIGR03437 family)
MLALPAMAQTATITATPASLSFTWITGSALPAAQALAVKAGTSTAAYTTAISPLGTQWITLTPASGNLPAAVSVLVNPSGLPVGTYTAVIQLTAAGIPNPLNVTVTMAVEAALPTLQLSATTLSFSTPPNPPATQTLVLTTTGGPVPFAAAVQSAAWMTVTPTSGVVLPGAPVTLTVSVTNTGLTPNTTAYAGKIAITATGVPSTNAQQVVAVSLLVNALTPTVTSLYPSAALVGSAGLTITVTGTGFYSGTTIVAATSPTPLKSTYVNPTTMLAVLPSTDLATAGSLNIEAENPAPGGNSNTSVFTVSATPVVQAVVSAASYAAGAVSPGEFVTLFGTGIGPATPAGMVVSNGYAATTVENVTVTIDGVAAPIIYLSANQITVQVPYTVTLGPARVVLVTNGATQSTGQVDTVAVAPGLFALAGNGIGQCAALTYSMKSASFSVNGTASPAMIGDIVVFYLTGEGIYDLTPSPATGYIVPTNLNPMPQLSPLPAVTIGGAAATVQYAGPVGGAMLGLLQINAVVPAGAALGNATPVTITIGAGTTQVGATIATK